MVFEGTSLQNLLKISDFHSKYRFQNRSQSQLCFLLDFGHLLEHFWSILGSFWTTLGSGGVSGLPLGDFGLPLASTWMPWVQLGRLGLPFWSQKSVLLDFCSILTSQFDKNRQNSPRIQVSIQVWNKEFHSQCVNLNLSFGFPPRMRRSPRSGLNNRRGGINLM